MNEMESDGSLMEQSQGECQIPLFGVEVAQHVPANVEFRDEMGRLCAISEERSNQGIANNARGVRNRTIEQSRACPL